MKPNVLVAVATILLASCSGGGGSSPTPISIATSVATSTPTSVPTGTPTNAPTSAPTVAPLGRTVLFAPSNANPTTLALRRRAQGTGFAPPFLVESAGPAAMWAGDFIAWVTDDKTGLDVTEASATATGTNGLLVNNPGITANVCNDHAAQGLWCSTHPTGWYFGTDSGHNKPVGKQTITIAFGDGATANITDYVYDGWTLACGQSVAYVSGTPQIVAANVADITYDCANQQVTFPHGVATAKPHTIDAFGFDATILPTVTSAVAVTNTPTSVSFANFQAYGVLVYGTADGGFAKAYLSQPGGNVFIGVSLHAKTDGSYAF